MSDVTSAEVVSFWREAGPERWFEKDDGFDLTIRTRFLAIHEAAARSELSLVHIERIKAFSEPAVDRSKKLTSLTEQAFGRFVRPPGCENGR